MLKGMDYSSVQSENDLMWARASLSSSAASYHFSIPLTCGFVFVQERVFMTYMPIIGHYKKLSPSRTGKKP